MNYWEALVTINAFRAGLTTQEMNEQMPDLKKRAIASLRGIGVTRKEIEREYPERSLYEQLFLIKHDPEAYEKLTQDSMFGKN